MTDIRNLRNIFTLIFILLFSQNVCSQQILKGQIKNTKGEAIANINILVYLPHSKILMAFAVSDEKGQFQCKHKITSDSLDIEVSSIQFEKAFRRIANISQNIDFELKVDVKQLNSFTVKAKPIIRKGDTLSYLVSSFAGKEDQVIEDVLRKMPGIEIEDNGQILYQGLALKKFYVEGLDLMDGRYGVISKNLPHRTVSTVEILENHQPIKILEERVESHQASLNLKLKKDITTTGTGKLGVGMTPLLWDVNLTPMFFSKKFQVVTSYQSNNTGNDVAQQINRLTIQDYVQNSERPNENPRLLSVQSARTPGIKQNRYLDNKSHLFNFNGLLLLSNDFQLRFNLYYINDHQQQEASQQRSLYTPTDTLVFNENIHNNIHHNYLKSEFTLSRNAKNNFLENKLKIQSRWDKQTGMLLTDNEAINQSLKNPLKSFSNKLRSINSIGKHLIAFDSYISYDHSPHSLSINPGQFEDVLNENNPYEEVVQQIDLKRLYLDHSASFTLALKRFSFTPSVGIAYRKQEMESHIMIDSEGNNTIIGNEFTNTLEAHHTRAYLKTNVRYKLSKLTINVNIPFSWRSLNLTDVALEKEQKLNRLFFDPSLSVYYIINSFWKLMSSWKYANNLGNIDRTNYGYILKTYRSLSQNAAPLSETSSHNFSTFLSYRNPISSFFNSFRYSYSIRDNNLMYSNSINADGTTILEAFYLPNKSKSHNLRGQTSKYFAAIKSTISLTANYNYRSGKSLVNTEQFNTSNQFYNFNPALYYKVNAWLNTEYSLDATYTKTYIEGEQKSNISLLKHRFSFFAFPGKNQTFSFSSEYYDFNETNNFFVDLQYRYTISKPKIDFEIRWNNVFNTKNYVAYQADSFSVWESIYVLRPSQIFLSVKFRF